MGSYEQSTYPYLLPGRSPRHSVELSPSPGWCSQNNPEGQAFYPDHFTSDTVRSVALARSRWGGGSHWREMRARQDVRGLKGGGNGA